MTTTMRKAPARWVLPVAITAIVLTWLEAREEARFVSRRVARAVDRWWAAEEHRDRRRLHQAELGYVLQRWSRGRKVPR